MEDLISVIIPVYNVEKYLEKCLISVLSQTYQNLEIILIDDGSTDGSGKICDEYSKKDKRIIVIHKENGGLSEARNYGINKVNGKYIVFVDSDDYVSKLYIEKLYETVKKYCVKIVQCNIAMVDENGKEMNKMGYLQEEVKTSTEMIKDLCTEHKIENTATWNKIYAVELFEKIRYPVGKIHEDEFITYKILYSVDKIAIIHQELYFYRQRDGSITKRKYSLKRLDSLQAMEERLKFFEERDEKKLYEISMEGMLRGISFAYTAIKKEKIAPKELQNDLVKEYRKYFRKFCGFKNVRLRMKIKRMMFFIFPNIFYWIQIKIRNKEE